MNGVMEMNEILHASHNLITTGGESLGHARIGTHTPFGSVAWIKQI